MLFSNHVFLIVYFCMMLVTTNSSPAASEAYYSFANGSMLSDNADISSIIKKGVEYPWWSPNSDYQNELKLYYANPVLDNIIETVGEYHQINTDWYTSIFVTNCHIVYNDKKTALAYAQVKEIDLNTNEVQWGRGFFTLHNINDGWRITAVQYTW